MPVTMLFAEDSAGNKKLASVLMELNVCESR